MEKYYSTKTKAELINAIVGAFEREHKAAEEDPGSRDKTVRYLAVIDLLRDLQIYAREVEA